MKKGISPLIATVLLVAFSIALAGIVSTYVINKTSEFDPGAIVEDSLLCDEVNLGFLVTDTDISNVDCEDVSGITLFNGLSLKNKGSFTIRKIQIDSPGIEGGIPTPINENTGIKPSASIDQSLPFTGNFLDAIIKITPSIVDPEENIDDAINMIPPIACCRKRSCIYILFSFFRSLI